MPPKSGGWLNTKILLKLRFLRPLITRKIAKIGGNKIDIARNAIRKLNKSGDEEIVDKYPGPKM